MGLINALYELVGERVKEEIYNKALEEGIDFSNCKVEKFDKRKYKYYEITPLWGSKAIDKFLNNIKFAFIEHYDIHTNKQKKAYLKSDRTKEDEFKFIDTLANLEYDNGYGTQELFGVVVFNDGTWLSRWEYDGSEGWTRNVIPEEKDFLDLIEKYNTIR